MLPFRQSENKDKHSILDQNKGLIFFLTGIGFCIFWSNFSEGKNPIDFYFQELEYVENDGIIWIFKPVVHIFSLILFFTGALAIVALPLFFIDEVKKDVIVRFDIVRLKSLLHIIGNLVLISIYSIVFWYSLAK